MPVISKENNINVLAKFFRGFSDSSRLSILEILRHGPTTVNEIVKATGLNQSNVSNHLGCLRECGLVSTKQEGRYVYYDFCDLRVNRLIELAEELLADVATGISKCTFYEKPEK